MTNVTFGEVWRRSRRAFFCLTFVTHKRLEQLAVLSMRVIILTENTSWTCKVGKYCSAC